MLDGSTKDFSDFAGKPPSIVPVAKTPTSGDLADQFDDLAGDLKKKLEPPMRDLANQFKAAIGETPLGKLVPKSPIPSTDIDQIEL